jgi:KilA-N domain
MAKNKIINVNGSEITILSKGINDYISLTDIAKTRNSSEPFAIINNWMRNRSTIEFIGLWEQLSNPDFKPLDFERFKMIQVVITSFFLLKNG